jgi:acid stress-induced BolA-like protein IbaG/YrbA
MHENKNTTQEIKTNIEKEENHNVESTSVCNKMMGKVKVKMKQSIYRPAQALMTSGVRVSQIDSRHIIFSALCTGHLCPPGDNPGTHFC